MEPTRPFSSRWLSTFKIFLFQQIYKFSTHIVKLIRNHSQFHLSISDDLILHLFQALLWSFKKETFGLLSQFAFVSGLDSGLSCSCCSFSSTTDISGRPIKRTKISDERFCDLMLTSNYSLVVLIWARTIMFQPICATAKSKKCLLAILISRWQRMRPNMRIGWWWLMERGAQGMNSIPNLIPLCHISHFIFFKVFLQGAHCGRSGFRQRECPHLTF